MFRRLQATWLLCCDSWGQTYSIRSGLTTCYVLRYDVPKRPLVSTQWIRRWLWGEHGDTRDHSIEVGGLEMLDSGELEADCSGNTWWCRDSVHGPGGWVNWKGVGH